MKVERECPICNTLYTANANRLKHGRQLTCSLSCSKELKRQKLSNKVDLTCSNCGCEFARTRGQVKSKHNHHFCSDTCRITGRRNGIIKRVVTRPYKITEEGALAKKLAGKKARETRIRRNNYGHTEETRTLLSHRTSEMIVEGRIPKRSKIEYEVADELRRLDISFIHQYPIRDDRGRFSCVLDFFIPDRNLAIEVNGTFWHSDIRFYPDGPKHPIQIKNAASWDRKVSILKERGIKLCQLWEYDIKQDIVNACSVIPT